MILALDVAFLNMGWCVVHNGQPVAWGTIHTPPPKNKKILASSAYATRCNILSSAMVDIIREHKPKGIVAELPTGSQNAKAAKLLGGAVGIVAMLGAGCNLPIEWILEGDSKLAAYGKRVGTKEKAMEWATTKYPQTNFDMCITKFEHVADALMAYNGLRNDVLVRTFG